MSLKHRTYNALAAFLPNNWVFAEYHKRSSGKKADYKRESISPNDKEIKDWKNAITVATDPENPRRGDLMRFYQNCLLDNHLASVIDTRILHVQRSSFKIVDDKGNENKELKQLLERPWFEDLIRLTLMSRFQGTTLIEMFDVDPETLELDCVAEIPQSNYIPHKGEVIREEYDEKGVSYKEGGLKDYYLQIGGDWDLGMLNQLAMIILAKKLGLGSWMGYIAKFGVPPVFVITDRMDTGRRDELFEMMTSWSQNQFAILQGNERIEIPSSYNVDAHNTFQSLIENICNKEISKRVLGGTASTDEKSFVGAAEIQERVAADRYEADKLLFKFIFNSKIRQRLARISPVYKDFDHFQLTWDNQETLDINNYIDAIEKLSATFVFDIEEIRARTGLPIIGEKETVNPFSALQAPEPKPPEKKTEGRMKPFTGAWSPVATTWDAAIQKLAEKLYSGEIKPSDIDKDLVLKTYAQLSKSAAIGWGSDFYDHKIAQKIRNNLLHFSGAKANRTLEQIAELKNLGLQKEAYLNEAKEIAERQNGAYLDAEKNLAARTAQTARDWQQFEQNKDIYPNLKGRTMNDNAVRPQHQQFEGIIKPVNEWIDTPPFDYRCRCWLEPTREVAAGGSFDVDPQFGGNAGISGEVFSQKHANFQMPREIRMAVYENTEAMKEYLPYNQTIELENGKKVLINDFADISDLNQNIVAAKKLAMELEKDIYIRPHININSYKNPELGIGRTSVKGDLKTFEAGKNVGNFIKNALKSANKQGCRHVVLDITSSANYMDVLTRKLQGELSGKMNTIIEKVAIIRGEKVVIITRKQIATRDFKALKTL